MKPQVAYYYASFAALLTAGAAILAIRRRRQFGLTQSYLAFLASPWKLATFAISAGGLTAMAPYSGDPTWDHWDASLMSILTFLTAPWAIGALFRCAKRQLPPAAVFVALAAWMLSASWSYDFYILFRKNFFSPSSLPNLLVSSVIYVAAGLFWNLTWEKARGTSFAFQSADWPLVSAEKPAFWRMLPVAMLFMLLIAAIMLPFLWGGWN